MPAVALAAQRYASLSYVPQIPERTSRHIGDAGWYLEKLPASMSSPSEQVRAKPRLNGTFVALGNETALWPEGRWLLEFEAMATVGISFVIVHASAHGTSDSSSECPSGTYDAYFPVTESLGVSHALHG